MSEATTALCPSGQSHPLGYICEIGREILARRKAEEAAHEHVHEHACCSGHEHTHDHAHEHVRACCETHDYAHEHAHEHACCDAHDHEHAHEHHEHGHGHEEFHVCEHKHEGALTLYFLSPLLHALQVAAAILVVNFAFGTLFFLVGEERVVGFLEGAGYWFQPLVAVLVGLVPNCASSVVLAETYAVGGLTLASCLAGLVTNTGLGILVLFQNAKAWKRNLAVLGALTALGIAVGYAGNALMLLF